MKNVGASCVKPFIFFEESHITDEWMIQWIDIYPYLLTNLSKEKTINCGNL